MKIFEQKNYEKMHFFTLSFNPLILLSIIYYKNLIFPSIVRAFWKIPTKKSVQIGQISRLPGNPISLML